MLLLTALGAKAQTYAYLTFTQADGTETSIAAPGTVITFADGNLVATTAASEQTTIALADLASMRFDETATGIETLNAATLPASTPVQVYDLQGRLVTSYAAGDRRAALYGLPAGIYILRANGRSQKVYVR